MIGAFVFHLDFDCCMTTNPHTSFHQVPPFGKGAIRRFPPNVSEVRQYAARHFEDILQVCHYLPSLYERFSL